MDRTVGFLLKIYPKISETFILEEILALERIGVRLHLFALSRPTDAIVHDEVAQVRAPVTYVPAANWRNLSALLPATMAGLLTSPRRLFGTLAFAIARREPGALRDVLRGAWLAHAMKRSGISHLHAHFISEPVGVAEMASRFGGLGYSISAHAKDIYLSTAESLARKLAGARFTVTCTEYNRRHLAGLAPAAAIHRMYHGVDQGRFHPVHRQTPADPPLILGVGRLREKKGFATLIEACRQLQEAGQAFRCEIVGYGEEQRRLEASIAAHGMQARIRLTGKLSRDQVRERYARASVFVLPSQLASDGDRDGIPNVLLEAMAMELPVISTPVSGIPELIEDGVNGLLTRPADAQALAQAIARLLRDRQFAQRLGSAGRKSVCRSFNNELNVLQLWDLLDGALAPPRAPSLREHIADGAYVGKA